MHIQMREFRTLRKQIIQQIRLKSFCCHLRTKFRIKRFQVCKNARVQDGKDRSLEVVGEFALVGVRRVTHWWTRVIRELTAPFLLSMSSTPLLEKAWIQLQEWIALKYEYLARNKISLYKQPNIKTKIHLAETGQRNGTVISQPILQRLPYGEKVHADSHPRLINVQNRSSTGTPSRKIWKSCVQVSAQREEKTFQDAMLQCTYTLLVCR